MKSKIWAVKLLRRVNNNVSKGHYFFAVHSNVLSYPYLTLFDAVEDPGSRVTYGRSVQAPLLILLREF